MKNSILTKANRVLVISTLLLFFLSAAGILLTASAFPAVFNTDGPAPLAGDRILAVLLILCLTGTVLCAAMLLISAASLALKKTTAAENLKWMILEILIVAVPLLVCGLKFAQLGKMIRGLFTILIS